MFYTNTLVQFFPIKMVGDTVSKDFLMSTNTAIAG